MGSWLSGPCASRLAVQLNPFPAPIGVEPVRNDRTETPVPPYSPPMSRARDFAPIATHRRVRMLVGVHPRSSPYRRARSRALRRQQIRKGPAAPRRTSARLQWNRFDANGKFRRPLAKNRSRWKQLGHRESPDLEAFRDNGRPPGAVSDPRAG